MRRAECDRGPSFAALLDYWFDELAPEDASAVEEHLLGCGPCSERLERLASLGDGVKRIVSRGGVGAVMTVAFLQRLKENGIQVREYRAQPSDSVLCTLAPEDDISVARLAASLDGVRRVDVVLHDPNVPTPLRFEDVPFDAAAGEVVFVPETAWLRGLGTVTQRFQLVAVDGGHERVLGDYLFNHRPYRPGA